MRIDKNKKIMTVVIIIYLLSMIYVWYMFTDRAPESMKLSRDSEVVEPEPEKIEEIIEDPGFEIKSGPDIAAIIVTGPSVTSEEIIENAREQGISYCETLEGSDQDSCIDFYWMWRAEIEEDPLICEETPNPGFIRQCKQRTAVIAVATAYYNESNHLENVDIVPSNIHLCDLIEYESDKDYCLNPKKAIEKNRYELLYRLQ